MPCAVSSSFSQRLFSTRFPITIPNPPDRKTFLFPSSISNNRHVVSLQRRIPIKSSPSFQPIEELPRKLQEIIKLFQSVSDQKSKYQEVLFYGKSLKPLDARFRTRENRVEGCVSHVWIRAFLDSERNVVLEADSDSKMTKGLAALLVRGLSGCPADEIARVSPEFITLLGLHQSLTPSRNNGFLNMLRLVQKKALLLLSKGEEDGLDSGLAELNSNEFFSIATIEDDHTSWANGNRVKLETSQMRSKTSSFGSRGLRIKEVLERELSPIEMELEDVSDQYNGHSDIETHFNLRIVSEEFEGKSMVKRHRLVYGLLEQEMKSDLPTLSIVAKSPSQLPWSSTPVGGPDMTS